MSGGEIAKQFEKDEKVLQEMGQHGKGERSFSIRCGNAAESGEPCAICREEVSGNRVPLGIFIEPFPHGGVVCPECAKKHAPELNMAVDLFYANGGDKKWRHRMQREESESLGEGPRLPKL
jgi:hypothetical protein